MTLPTRRIVGRIVGNSQGDRPGAQSPGLSLTTARQNNCDNEFTMNLVQLLMFYLIIYVSLLLFLYSDYNDVTIGIRASILQTVGPPSALGILFLKRRGWLAEKLHEKLLCQFLASQYVIARGFLPVAL